MMINKNRLKISILVPNLVAGGAERMMSNLARGLTKAGMDVVLVIIADEKKSLPEIPEGVNYMLLKAKRVLFAISPLAKYLKENRPDIIITSLSRINVATIIIKKVFLPEVKVVVRESNTFSVYFANSPSLWNKIINLAAKYLYPYCDMAVAVSKGVESDLLKNVKIRKDKVKMVYNPVVDNKIIEKSRQAVDIDWFNQKGIPVIVGIGRVTPQKDFSALIKAFAELKSKRDARLVIIGSVDEDKGEYNKLKKLVADSGLKDYVIFTGYKSNPFAYLSKASVFVLSSVYEGLPGVLIQALACGCPAVSTDCPSGPREILEDGKYGRLVPIGDHRALCGAIEATLDNSVDKEKLVNRGFEFSVEKATEKYLELFNSYLFKEERG